MRSNKAKLQEARKRLAEKRQKKSPLSKTPVSECDFLEEDPIIDNQVYTCLSFVTPTEKMADSVYSAISAEYNLAVDVVKRVVADWESAMAPRRAMKIRGSSRTMEAAQKRCEAIKEFDTYHHVFVGEVGKWMTFAPDAESIEDQVYAETELNALMKGKREEDIRVKQHYEERKRKMMDALLVDTAKENAAGSEIVQVADPRALDAQVQATKNSLLQLEDRIQEMRAKLEQEEAEFEAAAKEADYIPDATLATPEGNPMMSEIDK